MQGVSATELAVLRAVDCLGEAQLVSVTEKAGIGFSLDGTRGVLQRLAQSRGWVEIKRLRTSGCPLAYAITDRGRWALENASIEGPHDVGLKDVLSILDRITRDRLRAKPRPRGPKVRNRDVVVGGSDRVER